MRLFPKECFKIATNLEYEIIKRKLNSLIFSAKYDGFWDDKYLYLTRNCSFGVSIKNNITPNIKVEIIENHDNITISVDLEMKPKFEIIMFIVIFLCTCLQFFITYSLIISSSFNVMVIFPVFFAFLSYFIFYISNKWDSDGFRYDLNKALKS